MLQSQIVKCPFARGKRTAISQFVGLTLRSYRLAGRQELADIRKPTERNGLRNL